MFELQCCHRIGGFIKIHQDFFLTSTHILNEQLAHIIALHRNPEEARIPVPDQRFEWLCDSYKPASRVPAFLTCLDIAGLTAVSALFIYLLVINLNIHIITKGASTGAGLGNAFLSHVRSVDGIFQVVRAFDDAEVIHVEGDVDPLRDMDIIQTELRLKDIEWVEKHLDGLKKTGRALGNTSLADKAKKEEIVGNFISV